MLESSIKKALDLDWTKPGVRNEGLRRLLAQLDKLVSWVQRRLPQEVGEPPLRETLSTLEQIFASFRKGEGRRDPALVGVWHHWSYQGSSSMYSGASTSSETRRVMQLGADGSVVERSSHEGIGNFTGKDGLGNTAWTAGYGSQSNDGRTGTWTAGDGMLYVQWSDGASAAWQYQLGGAPGSRRLVLLAPGAREPIEWTEQR